MKYPFSRKAAVVDTYGSVQVDDPYRWMEDLDSPEVAAWVAAQNALTHAHLQSLPLRQRFNDRLTRLWDYPRTGLPAIENGRLFYARNSGLQKQAPIYMRTGVFDQIPEAHTAVARTHDVGAAVSARGLGIYLDRFEA